MIAHIIRAQDRAEVVAAVRALDRAMISGFYTLPLFYLPNQWAARWTTIERPEAIVAIRLRAGNLVAQIPR